MTFSIKIPQSFCCSDKMSLGHLIFRESNLNTFKASKTASEAAYLYKNVESNLNDSPL